MIVVILALMPAFLMGMYNTGYQHWLACGLTEMPFWSLMLYGLLAILPKVVVTYLVGLGIEFIVAQIRHEEIQEGFLVTGIILPMICPVSTPLWMLAVATAIAVIFVKEVFGGTGYNIFNVALMARAILFFGYPAQMSGDRVFVATDTQLGYGPVAPDGFTSRRLPGPITLERVRGYLHRQLPKAGCTGPRLPLLLLPRPAPCGQCAPHLGWKCHLPRHLPEPDPCRGRGKAEGESPRLPPEGARRGRLLHGRLHGPPQREPAAGLR